MGGPSDKVKACWDSYSAKCLSSSLELQSQASNLQSSTSAFTLRNVRRDYEMKIRQITVCNTCRTKKLGVSKAPLRCFCRARSADRFRSVMANVPAVLNASVGA